METINFESMQQLIQNQLNITNAGTDLNTKDVNFKGILSGVKNSELDFKTSDIINNLVRKYNIYITVTPNEKDKNAIHAGEAKIDNISGYNNSVIIPHKLLDKMASDPEALKSVEYAIKSDIDAFNQYKPYQVMTGEESTSTPLIFKENGDWEKSGMSVSNSDNSNYPSRKIREVKQDKLQTLKQNIHIKNFGDIVKGINKNQIEGLLNNSSLNTLFDDYLNDPNNLNYYNYLSMITQKKIKINK